jgi:hypothetical protein
MLMKKMKNKKSSQRKKEELKSKKHLSILKKKTLLTKVLETNQHLKGEEGETKRMTEIGLKLRNR